MDYTGLPISGLKASRAGTLNASEMKKLSLPA